MTNKTHSRATGILHSGAYLKNRIIRPEAQPIYLTTAFNPEDLDDLEALYGVKGYAYIRARNPNRNALAELMSFLEGGEASVICGCGMAAISTAMFAQLSSGDRMLSDKVLYSEAMELFINVFPTLGIKVDFADFTDPNAVRAALKSDTKLLYTETISNPLITVVDIEAVAGIAHSVGAKLVVDNTFTTSAALKPLDLGADLSINSLTKFGNGHSDAMCGSITGAEALVKKAHAMQQLLGTTVDPFTCWLVQRGLRTMDLRVTRAMDNATKLAKALAAHPVVSKVHHPSLESHPQHTLAKRMLKHGYGAMLSIVLPDDRKGINAFLRKLELAHYAMTLGGYRTTLSHPVTSSHYGLTEEERRKMGITFGLMRVSVGIEDPDDLVADFTQALEVFK